MRLEKLLTATFLMLVSFSIVNAQSGVHSEAYGKSVYWKKNNVHYQSLKKNLSPTGIYSDALGKTVFIGNKKTIGDTYSKLSAIPSLVYTDVELDWAAIQQDESLPALQDIFTNINTEITGFELILEESLLTENKLIELYRTGTNFGSYVVCTDLTSGAKLWDQSFNLTNDDRIEIDLSIYQRSDGNIEISGMRLLSPLIPNLFPFAIATRKILNVDNGELVSRNYTSFDEGGVICNNPNGQFGRTIPITEDEKYLTSCSYPSDNGEYIQIQFSMDQTGKLMDTIGFVPNILGGEGIETHKYIEAYRLSNNNIVVGSSSTANPTIPELTFSELLLLNPAGEFIERINVSEYLNYSTFFDLKVKGEHIMLSTITFDDFSDPSTYKNHVLILDQDGEVVVTLNGFRELDGESVKDIKITALDSDEFLFVSSDENHCFKYFKVDSDQDVQHLRTICLEEDIWISKATDIIYNKEGGIITSGSWEMQEADDTESFKGSFQLPLSALGITTSVEEVAEKLNKTFKAFPSPVSSELTILLDEPSNGTLQVFNSLGSLVMQQQLQNQDRAQLTVTPLLEGVYNIILIENKEVRSSSFVKMNDR